MNRSFGLLAIALTLAAAPVYAAESARQELASRQYLVGTWNCTFTVGTTAGRYSTTWSTVLDGHWLKQTYDQRSTANVEGFRAEYLIGYDEVRHGWVRFGAMTTGQYFAIRMADTPNGWGWNYVSLFPRHRPPSRGFDATFTKRSNVEYTVDGPTYPKNGVSVTEHHICMKAR